MAQSTLSVAATAVGRIARGYAEDPISGPDGLGADPTWAQEKTLTKLGWTVADFNRELEMRTTGKFAFFSGLLVAEEGE